VLNVLTRRFWQPGDGHYKLWEVELFPVVRLELPKPWLSLRAQSAHFCRNCQVQGFKKDVNDPVFKGIGWKILELTSAP
jgi:hypothetical protein